MRPPHHAPAFAALLLAAGCASAQPAATGDADAQAAPARSERTAQFAELVTTLADPSMDGRGPGHPGHDRARDYIVDQLKLVPGLVPAFSLDGNAVPLQPFDLNLGREAQGATLAFAHGETTTAFNLDDPNADAVPFGFSGAGAFDAGVTLAGYGIVDEQRGYDSFADADGNPVDLTGQAVVLFRYEPLDDRGRSQWSDGRGFSNAANLTAKAQAAIDRGAAAVFVVNPPALDAPGPLRPTGATAFGEDLAVPCFQITGDAFASLLTLAGVDQTPAQLQAAADEGTLAPLTLHARATGGIDAMADRVLPIDNIAFMLPGTGDLAHETVVVGAHYDHCGHGDVGSRSGNRVVHPGADDNASGTASVIMIADALAKRFAHSTVRDQPRRTVVFMLFTAEERGLIGSRYLCANPDQLAVDFDHITAMVNLDMIGRLKDDEGLRVHNTASGEGFDERVLNAAAPYPFAVSVGGRAAGGSDHQAFYNAGVPAIHLFTGLHGEYHTENDTADLINMQGGAGIAAFATDLTQQLATERDTVTYNPPAPRQPRRAYLGITPGESDTPGVRLATIADNSPAANAGLQPNDIITQLGDTDINTMSDLSRALQDQSPGDTVNLTVQRGTETLELEVELGGR